MKRITFVIGMSSLLALGGCWSKEEPKSEPKPATITKAPVAAPEKTPATTVEEEPEKMMMMMEALPKVDGAVDSGAVEEDAEPNALNGSTWKVGDFEINFKSNTALLVKGGPIADFSPDGVDGTYTLKEDGSIELSVMGQTRTGKVTDCILSVDGMAGEKVQ